MDKLSAVGMFMMPGTILTHLISLVLRTRENYLHTNGFLIMAGIGIPVMLYMITYKINGGPAPVRTTPEQPGKMTVRI